jgi:hypothetical protein
MSLTEITVQGTLKPDGTLELDEKPNLPPGRVTLVLRRPPQPTPPMDEEWFQYLQCIRKQMEEAGCHFMDDKEVQEHMAWLRQPDRIDELLRETDEQRRKWEES